jgi:hypothetical protein
MFGHRNTMMAKPLLGGTFRLKNLFNRTYMINNLDLE